MNSKLLILFFVIFKSLSASDQLVVVVGDDKNSSLGMLGRYEFQNGRYVNLSPFHPVVLGRNGMGWADGSDGVKMEGDGKSPAGIFPIISTFGYDPSAIGKMPYDQADDKLICVDDVNDTRYNTIIRIDGELPKSFEWMHREDGVYHYGAVIGYNQKGITGRGSCIFFHLNHADHRPTSGCTAMDEAELKELLQWLDPEKHPMLLQIPRSECSKYQKEFAGIKCE